MGTFKDFIIALGCGILTGAEKISHTSSANRRAEQKMARTVGKTLPLPPLDDEERIRTLKRYTDIIQKYSQPLPELYRSIHWQPSRGKMTPDGDGYFTLESFPVQVGLMEYSPTGLGEPPTYGVNLISIGFPLSEPIYMNNISPEKWMDILAQSLVDIRDRYLIPPCGFYEGISWEKDTCTCITSPEFRYTNETMCEVGWTRRVIDRTPEELEYFDAAAQRIVALSSTVVSTAYNWASVKYTGHLSNYTLRELGIMTDTEYITNFSNYMSERTTLF